MICPTCHHQLVARDDEPLDDYCPGCGTFWRPDLHVWLDLDPSGGDRRQLKLGPRSFERQFRVRIDVSEC